MIMTLYNESYTDLLSHEPCSTSRYPKGGNLCSYFMVNNLTYQLNSGRETTRRLTLVLRINSV